MPEGYQTETGNPLQESKIYDFIVNEDGDKNFGEITPEIERATNGSVKAAPIRLQVGNIEFGYIYMVAKHLQEMNNKGFDDAISYINNILQNINKVYISAETGSLNRFLLVSNGVRGHSDNFMPIDLELEQGEDGYYRIVTAYPKSGKRVEGILLFDDSTHSSSVTATDSLPRLSDDENGISNRRANAKSNIPSEENIPQTQSAGNSILEKHFREAKRLTDNELTSRERKWIDFGRSLGVKVMWLDGHTDLTGAIQDGTIYLNRRMNDNVTKTFWHEHFHMLSAINPELHGELLKYFAGKDEFTREQLDAYCRNTNRRDLTNKQVIEEILCDNFAQVQKRVKLMREMSADNPNLAARLVAWLKYLADKFAAMFRNPEGGMTTAQRDAFIKGMSNLAGSLRDAQGKRLFATYNGGKDIRLANGAPLPKIALTFGGQKTIASDEEYLQAVNDFQNAKSDNDRQAAFKKLQAMVEHTAQAAGFDNAIPKQTVAYKVRTTAPPKKTIKVYKVFTFANDGSPTALFVGGTEKLPQNVWLDAQDTFHFKATCGQ